MLYLVVGTLVWRYLSLIFYWITDLIGIERWEGTIEYTLMAPIRRITHMAGQTFFAVIYSLLFTGIILVVTVVLFEIDLSKANLSGGMVMMLAGSLSFIGVGIMGSVLPLLFPERGSQMTHVIIAVLLLVSGCTTRSMCCRSSCRSWQCSARPPTCWMAPAWRSWRALPPRSSGRTSGRP